MSFAQLTTACFVTISTATAPNAESQLVRQDFHLIRQLAPMVAIVLQLAGCGLPITHVHPYFGPTYGDGSG